MAMTHVRAHAVLVAALALTLAVLAGGCESRHYPPLSIPVGQALPSLALQDLMGKPVTLAPDTGKLLIINIWATWCAPCRHELPSLDRLARLLGPAQASVVGISVDSDSHVLREYLIERKLGFVNYRDDGRQVAEGVLGLHVFPTTLIVGPEGRLLKVEQGWRVWDSAEMVTKIRALIPTRQGKQ